MKNILLSSFLATSSLFVFPMTVEAVFSPVRTIEETENINIITTVTANPTPITTITIKPIKNIILKPTLKKTSAIKEIDRRLESLKVQTTKITGIVRLTAIQRETLQAQVQIEITKLEELRAKIEAETDATTLQEEKKSITESYRIYGLFIPKIEIIAHADKIITISDAMIGKTSDPALQTKIADSKAKAQSAMNLVYSLLPEQFPDCKTTLKTARDMLKTSRTTLNDVFSQIKAQNGQ